MLAVDYFLQLHEVSFCLQCQKHFFAPIFAPLWNFFNQFLELFAWTLLQLQDCLQILTIERQVQVYSGQSKVWVRDIEEE